MWKNTIYIHLYPFIIYAIKRSPSLHPSCSVNLSSQPFFLYSSAIAGLVARLHSPASGAGLSGFQGVPPAKIGPPHTMELTGFTMSPNMASGPQYNWTQLLTQLKDSTSHWRTRGSTPSSQQNFAHASTSFLAMSALTCACSSRYLKYRKKHNRRITSNSFSCSNIVPYPEIPESSCEGFSHRTAAKFNCFLHLHNKI